MDRQTRCKMPVSRARKRQAGSVELAQTEDAATGPLVLSEPLAEPLAPTRPMRRAPPRSSDASKARSAAEDSGEHAAPSTHVWPEQSGRRKPRGKLQSKTAVEASRAALDALRAKLRARGNTDPEVRKLTGWTATRVKQLNHLGVANGWEYKFTDSGGEVYRGLVQAACAAEPRDKDEETPSLLDEIHWEGERYRSLEELEPWQLPAVLRSRPLPPPPVDRVADALGGFKAAYGPDWTANKSHPDFICDDVKAMGGDMDDLRCSRPRTLIAEACQPADMRPPVLRRHVAPWTWIGGVKELAKQEPDLARRAALHELARVAKKIDLDCREAAKKTARKDWAEPRCCLAWRLCAFILFARPRRGRSGSWTARRGSGTTTKLS